jgi:hypothetical protein
MARRLAGGALAARVDLVARLEAAGVLVGEDGQGCGQGRDGLRCDGQAVGDDGAGGERSVAVVRLHGAGRSHNGIQGGSRAVRAGTVEVRREGKLYAVGAGNLAHVVGRL